MHSGIRTYLEREVGNLEKIEAALTQDRMTAVEAYALIRRIEKHMEKLEQAAAN